MKFRLYQISLICIPYISLVYSISDGFDCTFDGGLCGWSIDPPWNLATSILVPKIESGKPDELIHGSPYLVAQGSFGRASSGTLTSPFMAETPNHGVMNFAYSRYGNAEVEVLMESNDKTMKTLDTIASSLKNEKWERRTILIPANPRGVWRIIISLKNIRNGFDIFALDDVTFSLPKNSDEILTADDAFFKPDPISPDPVIHPAINREIRRSPNGNQNAQNGISDLSTNECVAIKCHFEGSACAWTFTNYRLVSGKMVSESEGESLLISEPVLIPKNSQFIIDIFASEMSSTSIYLRSGNEETIAWSQMGPLLPGWNHIKIPLKYSALPTTILIRSTNPKGAFTALTSSDIVDMNGKSLECGSNVPPIRPQRLDEYIRLTALQKLDPNDVRIGASLNEPPVRTYLPSRATSIASNGYTPPISPSTVSEAGIYDIQPKTRARAQSSSILNAAPYFPSLPLPAPSYIRNQNMGINNILPETNFQRPVQIVQTTESPLKRILNSFGAGNNPIMQNHLLELAKRFGFDKMNLIDAEKRGRALLETINAGRQGIEGIQGLIQKSSTISSALPSGRSINEALTNKILQTMPSPIDYGRDSKPFANQHLDYIVQNAYNRYQNQVQPG